MNTSCTCRFEVVVPCLCHKALKRWPEEVAHLIQALKAESHKHYHLDYVRGVLSVVERLEIMQAIMEREEEP